MTAAAALVMAAMSVGQLTDPQDAAVQDIGPGEGAGADIVVTAQRRSERLLDVPATIVARSADDLRAAGVDDVRSIELVTPSLKITRTGAYTQPAMRGVTSASTAPGTDPNVAIYLDGVYQPNQLANAFDLPDIERLEVLKGPQGTLFGRNATGGAILLTTQAPSQDLTGSVEVGYGRFNSVTIKGVISGPLIADTVAFSLAAFGKRDDGYIDDLSRPGERLGDLNSRLVRGKLLIEPAPNLSITATLAWSDRQDRAALTPTVLNGNTITRATANIIATRPWQTAVDQRGLVDVSSTSASLVVALDAAGGTFSSITGYQRVRSHTLFDHDGTPVRSVWSELRQPDRNVMQELNFTSGAIGRFNFVTGLFFYDDKSGYDPVIVNLAGGAVRSLSRSDARVRAYAAYFDGTWDVTDDFSVIGGLRYSWEKKSLRGVASLTAPLAFISDKSWDSLTPRVALRYALSDRINLYASYNQGFKSGAYNVSGLAATPVNPEEITAYEAGVKYARGSTNLALSAFHYRYSDQQVQAQSGSFNILQNAASSNIFGVEVEAGAQLTPDLRLTGGFAYLDAKYDRFAGATILVPLAAGGNGNAFADLSGRRMPRSPEWTGNLTAIYRRAMSWGQIEASGSVYYSARFLLEPSGRVQQPGYALLNGRIGIRPKSLDGLSVSVWGENLSNRPVLQSVFITNFADTVFYDMPRTYGVSVGFEF